VNFDKVAAWRLSPSGTAGGGSAGVAVVRAGGVDGDVCVAASRSGDWGDRGKYRTRVNTSDSFGGSNRNE
jgi:hypothetical protein